MDVTEKSSNRDVVSFAVLLLVFAYFSCPVFSVGIYLVRSPFVVRLTIGRSVGRLVLDWLIGLFVDWLFG